MPALRVCSLYPELMNIYADRGNIAVLRARCEWRGIGFEHAAASLGEPLDPDAHDLFYMGGGQDRDQVAVAHDMAATKRDALHAAADRGAVVLAVCGGYQLLGHSYELGGEELPGRRASSTCAPCARPGPRLIGNCAIEADLGTGPRVIAGFENHGGRTYLGAGRAAARAACCRATATTGATASRACTARNVIGTYLHGPLLPKNIWLADRLIELALGIELEPLPDDGARGRRARLGAPREHGPCMDRGAASSAALPAALPATRSTSATEVTPSRIFSRPSSRSVRMPSRARVVRASRRPTPFSRISLRNPSVIGMTS